jgi:hypothetical protein
MERILLIFLFLVLELIPALAQRIETENDDRTRIVHLKTALNHLTVIEVAEPVIQVAAGSPSFKVEWRENKVFVQPTEADAATNLFVWTANQRLNYELEPAGVVSDMDFAIDQVPAPTEPVKRAGRNPPPPPSTTQLLLAGKPVRLLPSKPHASKPIAVWISDVYEKDGRLLVRYAVRNCTNEAYAVDRLTVYQLDGVRSPQSLYGLTNSQLSDEQAGKLKAQGQTPIKVLDGETQPTRIAPGEEAVGVVSFEMLESTQPTILRFEFPSPKPSDAKLGNSPPPHIDAFLVR